MDPFIVYEGSYMLFLKQYIQVPFMKIYKSLILTYIKHTIRSQNIFKTCKQCYMEDTYLGIKCSWGQIYQS